MSAPAEKTILHAIRKQRQRLARQTAVLTRERNSLMKALKAHDGVIRVFPSDANFILVRVTNARAMYDALLKRGIVVRLRSGSLHCDNCLRITIGTPAQNKRLLTVLKSL